MTEFNDTFMRDLLLSLLFIFVLCVWFNNFDKPKYYSRRSRFLP